MKRLVSIVFALALPCAGFGEEPATLKEVTVTAKSADVAERRDSTTQKVIVSRQDIENLGVMTIGEVLGKLPGVEVSGDGQRARGMSRDSVQILIDGERPAGGSRMVAGVIGRLPSGELERVEILRGSSAEYGGASSVTVNLVMKKALSKRKTALKTAVGVRGNEPNAQLTWTENGGDGGFGWSLPVTLNLHRNPTQSTTDRQAFPNGVRNVWQQERDEGLYTFREFVLSPRMTWKEGGDSLTFAPLFFDGQGKRNSDTTSSDLLLPSSGTHRSRETNDRRMLRLRADGEKNLEGAKLTARMSLNQGKRTVDLVRESQVANVVSSTEHSSGKESEYNMAMRLDKPLGEHLFAVGVEHINLRRNDEQLFSGSFSGTTASEASERHSIVWLQDDWSLQPSVVLTAGVRGEDMRLASDGVSQQHGRLLPSIAVRWEPAQQWLLRSSLGAGLKLPRLDEISSSVARSIRTNPTPLDADRVGNPNLLPERSLNYEAVFERYLDQEAGVFGANLYVRSTEDFIERRVQFESGRWVDRPQNEGKALHWGWELDGKVRTDNFGWKGATVKAHLTLPNARVNDTRLGITRMARDTPDYVFSAGVDQSLPMWQSSYGVSVQMSGASKTDIPNEQRATTNAKTTLDAFWLYKLNPIFNLRVNAQNLLAAKTVRETVYLNGPDTYQLRTESTGFRALLVTLEGRW